MAGRSRGVGATITGCSSIASTDGEVGMDDSANDVWMLGTAEGEISFIGFAAREAIIDAAMMMTAADAAMIKPWTHRV